MIKIFVNGTFDVIHTGHLALLNHARSRGDYLVVAVDSDRRVKELKGATRPINTEGERKLLLENLKAVNEVHIFDSDQDLIELIKTCDIMIKGSDYQGKPIVGGEICSKIEFFERIDEFSSTKKIEDIRTR